MLRPRAFFTAELFLLLILAVFHSSAEAFVAARRNPHSIVVSHRRLSQTSLHAHQEQRVEDNSSDNAIRLNKVFKATHSRRKADKLIASGRVSINGEPVFEGRMVVPYVDVIQVDGKNVLGWEELNGISTDSNNPSRGQKENISTNAFEYIKYWKPSGVVCTTDRSIRYNIIDEIQIDGYKPKHRVYPVGRLDKSSTGLILLTSDGRLPNASLRSKQKQPKTYEVFVDCPIRESDLELLRNGIVITTVAQRDGKQGKPLTAKTKPCLVERIAEDGVRMTLFEGRNRQIRKMMSALHYDVLDLHRVGFMGISLEPLSGPGGWKPLDRGEMKLIKNVIEAGAANKGEFEGGDESECET